jgi:hypothetical protein
MPLDEPNANRQTADPPDTGTGYGRKPAGFNADWTLVGPGTKMGELLRRYWHPVGLAGHATDTPRALRVLGEDLILFRDKTGRPASTSRASPRAAAIATGCASPGIRCASVTA